MRKGLAAVCGCQTTCDGACVDTATDPHNCGACGNDCSANGVDGETCVSGTCGCAAPLVLCNPKFENASFCGNDTDANCCNVDCTASNAVCVHGGPFGDFTGCECPSGLTLCGQSCVDETSDSNNCGECGNACLGGLECLDGKCACGCGYDYCPGVGCINTQEDINNCGGCGIMCAQGVACRGGACLNGNVNDCQSGAYVCPDGNTTECLSNDEHTCCGAGLVDCTALVDCCPTADPSDPQSITNFTQCCSPTPLPGYSKPGQEACDNNLSCSCGMGFTKCQSACL